MESQSSTYSSKTVVELKRLLHKRNLPVSGVKTVLIDRLKVDDQKTSVAETIKPLRSTLTGVDDIDIQILLTLDDKSLYKICSVDLYASQLCNKDKFWKTRVSDVFGEEVIKYKPNNINFREQYETLQKRYPSIEQRLKTAAEAGRIDVFLTYSPVKLIEYDRNKIIENIVKHNHIALLNWLEEQGRLGANINFVAHKAVEHNNVDILNWVKSHNLSSKIFNQVFSPLPIIGLSNDRLLALKWLRIHGFAHTSRDADITIAAFNPRGVILEYRTPHGMSIETLRWIMRVGPFPTSKGADELLRMGKAGLKKLEILLRAGIYPTKIEINNPVRIHPLKVLELLVSYNLLPDREVIVELSRKNTIVGRWVKTHLL